MPRYDEDLLDEVRRRMDGETFADGRWTDDRVGQITAAADYLRDERGITNPGEQADVIRAADRGR